MGPETGIDGTTLYIREGIGKDAVEAENGLATPVTEKFPQMLPVTI